VRQFVLENTGVEVFVEKECDPDVLPEVASACRKLLASFGHVSHLDRCVQPRRRGIRILAMDGGGTRAIVLMSILQAIENRTGKMVGLHFGIICGGGGGGC
jgi:hypothetical protein